METNETLVNTFFKGIESEDFNVFCVSEGGSRAWGYSTPESDFDVKFVFSHQHQKYKALWDPRDNFTFKQEPLYDFCGWDLKKFLNLLYKGNAQCWETMGSDVTYYTTDAGETLKEFTKEKLSNNLVGVAYHYLGLTHTTYKTRMVECKESSTKKYFYVARPLLAVEQMVNEHRLPSLNFQSLLKETREYANVPEDVFDTFQHLLTMKRSGELTKETLGRLENVDKWVMERLDYYFKQVKLENLLPKTEQNREEYNEMFRKLLDSAY
jgi:hypothetical protein